MNEPRKARVVGVVHVSLRGDSTPAPQWPGARSPTGVREHGIRLPGSLQEPGRSCHLRRRSAGEGPRLTKDPGLRPRASPGRKSESGAHRRYVQDKGNRDWADGWREVRELNSTVEAGEPPRGTRWREGSSGARNRTEG